MMVMKKILIYALLLTHLFTGLVFASDTHSETFVLHDNEANEAGLLSASNHDAAHTHDVHSEGGQYYGELQYEDHHCHGSAHLVGLIYSQVMPFVSHHSHPFWLRSQASVQVYTPPLLRPPIV